MDVLQTLSHIRTTQRNTFCGAIYIFDQWFKEDARHRERGPASIMRDQASGVAFREAWWRDGTLHRLNGPAVVARSIKTGRVTRESWWQHDRRHRIGGPAVIARDAVTGAIIHKEWWLVGKRVDLPAKPELSKPARPKPDGPVLSRLDIASP